METLPRRWKPWAGGMVLPALLLVAPNLHSAPQDGDSLHGQVEFLYRSVSTDGSEVKYDEDFDALQTGVRVGDIHLDWNREDGGPFDFMKLNLTGFGGDPFEYGSLQVGRKDVYDFRLIHRKQTYLYDLLAVTDDVDGHAWNTDNRRTSFDLSLYPHERVEVMVGYHQGRREGDGVFLKDIQRDVYFMDAPVDRTLRRYSLGVDIDAGPVDIFLRQTQRHFDNQFDNGTFSDSGLDPGNADFLDFYEWRQNDQGKADLTELRVLTEFGRRVSLDLGYYGTLFGEEEIDDRVDVNASGLDFSGNPFSLTDGFNEMEIRRETDLVDVDLSVLIANPVILHLGLRSLEQETESLGEQDLQGSGLPQPIATRLDWSQDAATVLVEVIPADSLSLRGGYRTIDRELDREGFLTAERNENFESDGDETLLFGFSWRPAASLHFTGDYEDGTIEHPFTDVSLSETRRLRLRAGIRPTENIRLNLTFRDFENENRALTFDSESEGRTWAATYWQQVGSRVNFLVGYTRQEVDTAAAIVFDTAGFGGTDDGDTLFDVDNESWQGQVNVRLGDAWEGFARIWAVESQGDNLFIGDTSGVISAGLIDQDFVDWEVGVTRSFAGGFFLGGSARMFDYEDVSSSHDYDGLIVTARGGYRF